MKAGRSRSFASRRPGEKAALRRDLVDGERPADPAQRLLAEALQRDGALDRGGDALRHQDLAVLGMGAEARGHVGNGADRGVLLAPLEADRPDRGEALRDADAEADAVAAPRPVLLQP